MNRRAATARRCAQCKMVQQLCICAVVPSPPLEIHRTRVVVVVHHEEAAKPTNTGLLAARCLAPSRVVVTGRRDAPITASPLDEHEAARALLLFPSQDATPITHDVERAGPVTLVVPDGTWRQARKMRARVPGLAGLQCVTLPERSDAPTTYRLRAEKREGGLSTLEAIARAVAYLEGGDEGARIEQIMLDVFRVMVERTLWLRGAIGDDEVTGGVPAAARAHDPRGGLPHRRSE